MRIWFNQDTSRDHLLEMMTNVMMLQFEAGRKTAEVCIESDSGLGLSVRTDTGMAGLFKGDPREYFKTECLSGLNRFAENVAWGEVV